jgi:ABC-2 type transport system permease protein
VRQFDGTLTLTWLALKRDRIQLPIWILAIAGLLAAFAAAYKDLYQVQEELTVATEFYALNPVARIFGVASGDNLGAYTLVESFLILSVLTALMSVLAVVRHTRQSEETRQAEMLSSTPIGRYSLLTAALLVAVLANLALVGLIALAFVLHGLDTPGALTAGAAFGGVGLSFSAVAAVTSQVSPSSRGASGMAAGVIGAAVLLASVGGVLGTVRPSGVEVDPAWPSWLSPFGWGQLMRAFGENNWWLLLPFAGFSVMLFAVAVALVDRRDLGRGMLAEGRGPARASSLLGHPVGLVWRLQRGVFIGWAVAMIAYGFVMGAIAGDMEELLGELDIVEVIERIGGTGVLLEAYFVTMTGFMGSVVAAYTLQVLLRMRIEEADGPLESILSMRLSRVGWVLSYVLNAVLGTLALLLLLGASTGFGAGLSLGEMGRWLPDITVAGLVQAPAAFVVAAVAIVVFGLLPRLSTSLSWAVFAVALLLGPMLGEMLNLPGVVTNASPFTHTPAFPAAPLDPIPLLALTAVAAALTFIGFISFRRRDLAL